MQTIILLAYKFPPYAGVGGFRWAKLCKYLANLGFIIHVVTVNWPNDMGPNTFVDDVNHENIIIHRIPSGYSPVLKWLSGFNKGRILDKICLRLKSYFDQLIYYDDEAQQWGRYLVPFVESLLRQYKITLMISTGHPFQVNRWAAEIKVRNPQVTLIQDLQDPWVRNNLKRVFNFNRKKVLDYEKYSIKSADCIVCVTDGLAEHYKEVVPNQNYVTIENGVDLNGSYETCGKKYTFIYSGNITNHRDKPFSVFLEWFAQALAKNNSMTVVLIGQKLFVPEQYNYLVSSKNILLFDALSQNELFNEVIKSKFALQLNAETVPYLVSTKIYEYGILKIPTVSINYGGEIDKLINNYSLGYSLNLNNISKEHFFEKLDKIISENESDKFRFDIDQFKYSNLAVKYKNLINKYITD